MSVSEIQMSRTAGVMMSQNDSLKHVSIGTLATSGSAWDASKALNIMSALVPCLDGSFSYGRTVPTYRIEED